MVYPAYGIAAMIYLMTITLAVKLFGVRSQSFALTTFAPTDSLATLALTTFGISVMSSFPLLFFNLRQYVTNYLFPQPSMATVSLLLFVGFIACFCRDVGIVGGFSGAILGTSMMFVFPPLMYMAALLKTEATRINELNNPMEMESIPGQEREERVEQMGLNEVDWKDVLKTVVFSSSSSSCNSRISKSVILFNSLLLLCGVFLAVVGTANNVINLILLSSPTPSSYKSKPK